MTLTDTGQSQTGNPSLGLTQEIVNMAFPSLEDVVEHSVVQASGENIPIFPSVLKTNPKKRDFIEDLPLTIQQ